MVAAGVEIVRHAARSRRTRMGLRLNRRLNPPLNRYGASARWRYVYLAQAKAWQVPQRAGLSLLRQVAHQVCPEGSFGIPGTGRAAGKRSIFFW